MVGKIVVNGFPEFLSYDLGADLDDVRDYLPNISFNEPGIHILKLQPGIGKSYAIKEFLKKAKKLFNPYIST